MSDKDKYYIDGYGTKRPKDVPFWDSAKGQLVKKAGNDLLTTGSFALGLLLPFGKLKILKTLSRVLNGAAIADFVTSDRVTTVDDDIKNGEYGKAAVTGLEALLTAGAIGSGFSKLPGVQKRAAMFARDGLVKDKMVVHRAIALPKGKNKPDLQYKRTGENVYEIPETEKYVGSYDTAVSSVNPKDLKRTVVEHYKLPAKKVRVLEHNVYPDGQVDLVASISNDILPTSYSFINRAHPYKLSEDVLKNIPMYNWESVANRIRNSFGISGGLGATGTYIYLRNEKGSR